MAIEPPPADAESFEFARMTAELHRLVANGLGDEAEAESLRDEMLTLWVRLGEPQRSRGRGLSADLYMLEDEEIYQPHAGPPPSEMELTAALRSAWDGHDWDRVLEILRAGKSAIEPDQVAYLRGRCWWGFGHLDVALLFFDHAARLEPGKANYQALAAELLIKLGRMDEVLDRAGRLADVADVAPGLRPKLAEILIRESSASADLDQRARQLDLASRLMRTAAEVDAATPERELDAQIATSLAHAG